MIKILAINNEHMWVDERRVLMVGPLMDRGLRELGRAVLYFDGLPPLPCRETMDELAERVERGIKHGSLVEDQSGSVSPDGRPAGGSGSGLVVSA